jgi:hypothetical protein
MPVIEKPKKTFGKSVTVDDLERPQHRPSAWSDSDEDIKNKKAKSKLI